MAKEAVLGILIADNKVWLGLRRNKPLVWSPPGGFIEEGEMPEQALCRELAEEVGVCPEQAAEMGSFIYQGLPVRLYAAKVDPGQVALSSDEFAEGRWWDLDDLPSPLSPSAKLLARAVRLAKDLRLIAGAGNPDARIAFVGEAPGREEVEAGRPFAGPAGEWLEENVLAPLGLSRDEVWLTNAISVYLEEPKRKDVERWRGFLLSELEKVKPKIVVALGELAALAVLGEKAEPGTWYEKDGWRVFVMRHPAYAMRFDYPELKEHLASLTEGLTPGEDFGKASGYTTIMGNLDRVMPKILQYIPSHKNRVELFCGRGELIWHLDPPEGFEVLNDKDPDVIRMHRTVQDLSDDDIRRLERFKWEADEGTFYKLRDEEPEDDLRWLYRRLYLARWGRRSAPIGKDSFRLSYQGQTMEVGERLRKSRDRLRGVKLSNLDYKEAIAKYDSEDTFFFCDPPYPGRERYYAVADINWDELFDTLKRVKGKWMLVFTTPPEGVKEGPVAKFLEEFTFVRSKWPSSLFHFGWEGDHPAYRWFYIVANYDLSPPEETKEVAKVSLADLLDPRVVASLSDTELRAKHWRLHQNWAGNEGDESLLNAHLMVLREMVRRGMAHRTESLDSLDEQSFRMDPELREQFRSLAKDVRLEAADFFAGAEDFVYVNDYISLTGSFVYPQIGREPNDIDIVIRQSFPDPKLELKLVKMAKTLAPGKGVHFIYDPAGANFYHVPLFDLVARKKANLQPRAVEEQEYAENFYETSTLKQADTWTRLAKGRLEEVAFDGESVIAKQVEGNKPFKPHPPYEVAGEFYEGENEADVRRWVEGWLERGQTVLINPKFDGLRFLIHRDGEKIEFYTADTLTPRAEVLKSLADEFRKLKAENFIIDVELVEYPDLPWQGKEPKPRYQMVWLSTAKDYAEVADREKNVVAFCHDLTYLNGQDYSAKGYAERFAALKELLDKVSDRLAPASTGEVKKIEDLDAAIKAAFDFPGSEGAMLKASGFPYKIQGANQGVAKFKRVIEIDCLIIGYRPQTKGKPKAEHWTAAEAKERLEEQLESGTYLFRCTVAGPGGKLVPIEANHIITKQDIDLAWDEERQEWEGQEGPRFWRMAPGWPHVKEGDIAYGKTYARKWEYDDEPFGYIATVAPVEIQVFDKPDGTKGIAWMFPRVRNFKPKGSPVAKLEDVLAAFGHDPALAKEIVPSHTVEKRQEVDVEETVELTHEEQRKLEQELYGDPYLVRQPPPEGRLAKTFPWVLMRHLRGIWSTEQREELAGLLDAYERTKDPELLKRVNKEFEPWYFTGQDLLAYLKRIYETGEKEGDVAAAVESELRKGLPAEFERDRIFSRGNVHSDWRFKSPEGEWLFGWTVMTPSVVLQKLNGDLVVPLRDKVLEHEEGDNVVCARKAAQPVSWLTVVSKERPILEVKPGEVGATEKTAGEFHFVASGRYVMGVSKTDAHEYFVFVDEVGSGFREAKGILPGRWMFRMIQGEFKDLPRSVWITNKPFRDEGQWPYVLTHKLSEEEAKAKKENVRMFWNGPETIANLRALDYPLPENAEAILVENMAKRKLPMPVTFDEWGRKPGYLYVELFDFDLIDPKTFLVLPFAGREKAWEVTAEFKEPVLDPFAPGKQLEKGVIGYLFDAKAWTREQVAELLGSMGLEPGEKDGQWQMIEKRLWETTIRIVKAEKRLVTGIVLEPYTVDAQDDFCLPEDIEEAMFRFMRDYARPGYMHKEYDRNLRIIENWIVRSDYYEGRTYIRKGTWMMTMWVGDDEIWEQVKKGEITGFSIKGTGRRVWQSRPPIAA